MCNREIKQGVIRFRVCWQDLYQTIKPSYLLQLNDIYGDNGQRFIFWHGHKILGTLLSLIFLRARIFSSLLAVTSCISRHICKRNFVIYCIWYHRTSIYRPRLAIAAFAGRSFSDFNSYHNKNCGRSSTKCSSFLALYSRFSLVSAFVRIIMPLFGSLNPEPAQSVRRPVSANPGLNFNPSFFYSSIPFRVSNHQIVGKEN